MSPSSMFVYGTLMPGRLRWPILEPFAVAHRPAMVAGSLFDSGRGWPVATFGGDARSARSPVPGVLVELDPSMIDRCLAVIDEVEGVAAGQYRRVVVTTDAGSDAWTYDFAAHVDGHRNGRLGGLVPITSWHAVPLADER